MQNETGLRIIAADMALVPRLLSRSRQVHHFIPPFVLVNHHDRRSPVSKMRASTWSPDPLERADIVQSDPWSLFPCFLLVIFYFLNHFYVAMVFGL